MSFVLRLVIAALILVATALAIGAGFVLYTEDQERRLFIAAGPSEDQPFAFARAIAAVIREHHPGLILEVVETGGSRENVELLDQGRVDFATTQADTQVQPSARLVALLYPDAYQLIVRADSDIETVPDLRGHRIGLPPSGSGQFESFWFLADHYGLSADAFQAFPMSIKVANWALIEGAIDAVFRVRSPGDPTVFQLIEAAPTRLVPIDQAAAMHLKQPSIEQGSIPRGSYRGYPPLPTRDLETARVQRLLVTRADLNQDVVAMVTRILFERRQDLVDLTPLAGFIESPQRGRGTFLPVHPGAQRYYDREKPSYLAENAEMFALMLSVLVVLGSAGFALKGRLEGARKNRVDHYNQDLVRLCLAAETEKGTVARQRRREELLKILATVVDELDKDRVSLEGFETFAFTWQAAASFLREESRSTTSGDEQGRKD